MRRFITDPSLSSSEDTRLSRARLCVQFLGAAGYGSGGVEGSTFGSERMTFVIHARASDSCPSAHPSSESASLAWEAGTCGVERGVR